MTAAPKRCVVDASVAIPLVVAEPLSGHAQALFERQAQDSTVYYAVPDLFYAECANVLWKYVQRFNLAEKIAKENLARIASLDLHGTDLRSLAMPALKLALAFSVSAYDACYLAAAERLHIPLVTADERLVQKLAKGPVKVLGLGDLDLPSVAPEQA